MRQSSAAYLGFDLGAGSGRAVAGVLEGGRLALEEINRFPNAPVRLGGRLYWDFLSLWNDVLASMRLCAERGYRRLAGLGVDTWGVDYGLLGSDDALLRSPICYRDSLTEGINRAVHSTMGEQDLFRLTGVPPTPISTLSQLVAERNHRGAGLLKASKTLLMMPDLFRYFLSGQKGVELTAAGTSQLVNIRSGRWCSRILKALRLPRRLLPEIVRPGTGAGRLLPELTTHTGLNATPVIAVAGHDTASAGAAVPFVDHDCAFLSCGTWTVLGVIQDHPDTSAAARSRNFTNVIGVESILFVKNGMGLYLFENLSRVLACGASKSTYAELIRQASLIKPFGSFLDVNSSHFFVAEDPAACVKVFLRKTGQKAPRNTGSIVRALLEGLAWSCRCATRELATLTGRRLRRLSLVGGGSRNRLLCQMVADATGLEVIAGPAEATVAGNLATQALATGRLQDTAGIRELVRNSFKLTTYKPKSTQLWDKNEPRYLEMLEKSKRLK